MPTAANIYYKRMNLKKLGILILSLATLFFCLGAEGRGDDFEYVKSHLMGLVAADGRQLPSEWNSYPDGYEAALRTALDNLALTYIGENWMGPDPPDTPVIDGLLGYHIHTGKHAITRYDWLQYIRFADIYLAISYKKFSAKP
jgi:hypothetical protein